MTEVNRMRVAARHRTSVRPAWLLVLVVAMGSVGCAQHRIPDGPPLQIHRGGFGGDRFSYDSPAEESVWNWFQLDPAFVSTLERHPVALEEARKAKPFRTGYWIGFAGWTVFMIKGLSTALSSADNPTSSAVESAQGDFAVAIGFALAMWPFDALARRYVNRAASLFNVEEMRSTEQEAGEQDRLGRFLRDVELSPTYRPAAGFGWVARIPAR